ncbi:hypothetical protein M433DRAFT_155185 [Acidomyces richmondensis BFW]|nr:hypothetical protein M433DRAFT_155185 [Acidomyces richmondensis BFW]
MTVLSFASRSTIRRLESIVHRSILRQHQARYKNSNSNATPSEQLRAGRTIPGTGWAWIDSLSTPVRAYGAMQKRSPLLTQLESTMIIYYVGDLSAQAMQTDVFTEAPYEPIRGLRALTIACIASIPAYKWFMFLGNHFNYTSHWLSIGVKILINQTVFTPIFNTYFFGMQSLLSGATWMETKQRVVDTVPVSWKNSWKLWPAVTAFSFTYIQPQYRNVFAGFVTIGWQTYLSWLNKNAESSKEVENKKGRTK